MAYTDLIQAVEIHTIFLENLFWRRHWPANEDPVAKTFRYQTKSEWALSGSTLIGKLEFKAFGRSHHPSSAGSRKIFDIRGTLVAVYSLTGDTSDVSEDDYQLFSQHNLRVNVHPYLREAIMHATVAMGLAPVVIGVQRRV